MDNKINGYTEEEAKNLVEFIKKGKSKGQTLAYLFEVYGLEHGRCANSVRNYYYALMKNEKNDERITHLLDDSGLAVKSCANREKTKNTKSEKISTSNKMKEGVCKEKAAPSNDFLRRRFENYFNALYEGVVQQLKEENEQLRRENAALKSEFEKDDMENKPKDSNFYDRLIQKLKVEKELLRAENDILKSALGKPGKKKK